MIGNIKGVNDPSLSGPGRPRWLVVATGTVFRVWPDPNDRHSVPRRTYWPVRPRSGQCRKATEHRRTCTHYLSHAVASSMFNRSTPTMTQAFYYFPEPTGISHSSSFSHSGGLYGRCIKDGWRGQPNQRDKNRSHWNIKAHKPTPPAHM
jgi:hypothetical protein